MLVLGAQQITSYKKTTRKHMFLRVFFLHLVPTYFYFHYTIMDVIIYETMHIYTHVVGIIGAVYI